MTTDQALKLCGSKIPMFGIDPFTYRSRMHSLRDTGAFVWYAEDGNKWIIVFENKTFEYFPKNDLLTDGPLIKQKFGFVKLMAKIGNLKQ